MHPALLGLLAIARGGGWTPAQATTDGSVLPEHWYDASVGTWQDSSMTTAADQDNDVVGGWEDQAASGDDVSQGTTASKPTLQLNELNDEAVLRFDGTDDFLQGAFTVGGGLSQPVIVFFVGKLSGAINDDVNYYFFDGDDSTNRILVYKNKSPTPDKLTAYAGILADGTAPDNNWHIFCLSANGASSKLWIDGVVNLSANIGNNGVDGITIGARYSATECINGDIAEIIIYGSNLSDADKNQIGQYLDDKYGITWSDIS